MTIPFPGEVLAAIFTSGPRTEVTIGPCDRMTEPEPEAEVPW